MKRILSYLLLCIYATIMIKPVMPTITDMLAHLLNYSEHMATVHHSHGGKSHVHYEYIEAAKKNSHEDNPYNNIFKKGDGSSEHILFTTAIVPSITLVLQEHSNSFFQNLPVISLPGNFRPPITLHT
ncbi:MAG: hypothetical protein ABI707_08100 [Ferruginibacter sp.]